MAENTRIQWHPAFCEAMRLTLREDDSELTYETEHQLSRKPLQIDLLIIRKRSDHQIHNMIGRIFGRYNLFEYKSPEDALNIDVYYKVLAYGCLYKSLTADHVNEIRKDDITLTIVRYGKPVRMFEDLQTDGIDIENVYPGIYYLHGATVFRTQVIVARELPDDEFSWIRALTDALDRSAAERVVSDMNALPYDSWERQAADSVVQVSVSANESIYDRLKKEDPLMCDALRELMRPEFEEMEQQVTQQVTQKVTQQVTKQVTKQVRDADLKESKKQTKAQIRTLHKQNIPADVLKLAFDSDLVDEALGLNSKK